MTHPSFPVASPVHTRGFRRLVWALLVTSWGIALLVLGLSLLRWAAIGHTGGWVDWLPMPALPMPALLAGLKPPPTMAAPWRWLGAGLECVPALALFYTVGCVHRICRAFLAGAVFGPEVIRGFRGLGWGFLAMLAASLVYQAAVTALLSWLASGQSGGLVALGLGSFEISVLVVGLMMLLLGHVLAEGSRLQAEADAFV